MDIAFQGMQSQEASRPRRLASSVMYGSRRGKSGVIRSKAVLYSAAQPATAIDSAISTTSRCASEVSEQWAHDRQAQRLEPQRLH